MVNIGLVGQADLTAYSWWLENASLVSKAVSKDLQGAKGIDRHTRLCDEFGFENVVAVAELMISP